MTQNILSSMEDDEVNSISDTVSSLSVAQIVVDCFYELVEELELPGFDNLVRLESLSDVTKPNYLKLPDNYKFIHFIKYNNKNVTFLEPLDFVSFMLKRDEGVSVKDFGGAKMKVKTDSDPTYWTTFDDTYIVFDSFNIDTESTLLESKSLAFVNIAPVFTLEDDSIPQLPVHLFSTLLAKARAVCFVDFKQVSNSKAEMSERRGIIRHQNALRRSGKRTYYKNINYGKPRR